MSGPDEVYVRAATPSDVEEIGRVWQLAWHDAHDGHVPEALQALRTAASFYDRAAARVENTLVAVVPTAGGSAVAGFVAVDGDEVEEIFVDRPHRGTAVAGALMAAALGAIGAAGHREAWLGVVDGNRRARRFYEKQGFVDHGVLDYAADGPAGPIPVPHRRYVRSLGRPALAEALDLLPHPEGGWYRQTWASPVNVELPGLRVRPTATLILFLLAAGESSSWHRVVSDEVWIAQRGRVVLELGGSGEAPSGSGETRVVDDEHPHVLVAGGVWQRTLPGDADALVSCVVSPGFDFSDFDLAADPARNERGRRGGIGSSEHRGEERTAERSRDTGAHRG